MALACGLVSLKQEEEKEEEKNGSRVKVFVMIEKNLFFCDETSRATFSSRTSY